MTKYDDDGDVSVQGIGTKQDGIMLVDVLDAILSAPGVKSHVCAELPELCSEDYDACELALTLLASSVQMFTELLPVESAEVDIDAWVARCMASSLGELLRD